MADASHNPRLIVNSFQCLNFVMELFRNRKVFRTEDLVLSGFLESLIRVYWKDDASVYNKRSVYWTNLIIVVIIPCWGQNTSRLKQTWIIHDQKQNIKKRVKSRTNMTQEATAQNLTIQKMHDKTKTQLQTSTKQLDTIG